MTRPETILSSLRRERLPFALVGMLVVVLQLLLIPAAVMAAPAPDGAGIILCLGADADPGDHVPASHHGSDTCPCGPLCLHALSAGAIATPPVAAVAIDWPRAGRGPVHAGPRQEHRPDTAHLTARAIRAPPVSKDPAALA